MALSPTLRFAGILGWQGRFPRGPPPWSCDLDPPTRRRTHYEKERYPPATDGGISAPLDPSQRRLAEAIQQIGQVIGELYDNTLATDDQRPIQDRLIKPGKHGGIHREMSGLRAGSTGLTIATHQYCGDVPPVELERATALNTEGAGRLSLRSESLGLTGAIHAAHRLRSHPPGGSPIPGVNTTSGHAPSDTVEDRVGRQAAVQAPGNRDHWEKPTNRRIVEWPRTS